MHNSHDNDARLRNAKTVMYWVTLAILVVLTVADNVLVVSLFDEFTEVYAQYVNQGTAFVYIIASSVILFVRWLPCCRSMRCFWDKPVVENPKAHFADHNNDDFGDSDIGMYEPASHSNSNAKKELADGKAIPKAPWYVLVGIGLFNGSGNFLMAIAQPHTPGLTQALLGLLGIPLVMILSAIFLKKKSN